MFHGYECECQELGQLVFIVELCKKIIKVMFFYESQCMYKNLVEIAY